MAVGILARHVFGQATDRPYAIYEERLNRVLRDSLNCLRHRIHVFAEDGRIWDTVMLCLLEENFLRAHPSLRESADNLQTLSLPKGVTTCLRNNPEKRAKQAPRQLGRCLLAKQNGRTRYVKERREEDWLRLNL